MRRYLNGAFQDLVMIKVYLNIRLQGCATIQPSVLPAKEGWTNSLWSTGFQLWRR